MLNNTLKIFLLGVFLISNSVLAINVTILNHNFEHDAIPPSPGWTTHITGWVNSGQGLLGVFSPGVNSIEYHNIGGRAQVAYLNEGARISQTTSVNLIEGETYTLSFDVGQRLDQTSHNFVTRIKAKGHILAQLQSDSFVIPSGVCIKA